jgi:hypothetical protein
MFDPLPESVIATLRSNETTALATMLIVGAAFPHILAFAARVLDAPEPQKPAAKRRRPLTRSFKSPAGRRREQGDEKLVAAMKASPGATIGALAEAIGKSRTSTVTALQASRPKGDGAVDRAGRRLAPRPRGRARARLNAAEPHELGLALRPLEVSRQPEGQTAVLV